MSDATSEAITKVSNAIIEALADLDGLIDLLRLIEEAPEKPDLSNLTLRPILATIRRAAGNVSAGVEMLANMEGQPS